MYKTQLSEDLIVEVFENQQIKYNSQGKIIAKYMKTTVGRVIFNKTIYESLLSEVSQEIIN